MAKGWRTPARLTNAHADDDTVARAATRALAQTLREAGGCPHLEDITTVVLDVHRELTQAPLLFQDPAASHATLKSAYERLNSIEMKADRHNHTVFAADVARAYIVKTLHANLASGPADAIADAIATGFCLRMVEHYYFDIQRTLIIGSRFHNYEEARAWENDVKERMAPKVAKIARDILRDSTGQTVKTPRWPKVSRSTAELLAVHVELGSGG
jgi:hypothetical protein